MESQTTWLVLVLVFVFVLIIVLVSVGKASYLSLNSNNTMCLSCDKYSSSTWIYRNGLTFKTLQHFIGVIFY